MYALLLVVIRPIELLATNDPIVYTERGEIRVPIQSAPSVQYAIDLVTENTSETDAVLSVGYASWINFAADRPSSVWQTQTFAVTLTGDNATSSSEQFIARPPHLVIEEFVFVGEYDSPQSGVFSALSRKGSPQLWNLIDDNYVACTEFIDGEPRRDMWGLRVYTLHPDSPLITAISGEPPTCDQILEWSASRVAG